MLHLRPSDFRVMPWKDGGGSTTEIAIEPPGAGLADAFLWRVSTAQVAASGPFSRFPGQTRSLVLLEGAGFLLDMGSKGRQRLKHPGQVVTFSGDDTVNATLIQGPCVDFGVISDPRRVTTTIEWLTLWTNTSSITLAPTTLLFAPWGAVQVDPLGTQVHHRECLYFGSPSGEPEAITQGVGSKLEVRAVMGTTPLVVVSFWPA
jgi:environmental stress-induced protein Ves